MREIKFRAVTREGHIIQNIGTIDFFTDGSFCVNEEIPTIELLQFTGLKDKNGKEIYEGDVCVIGDQQNTKVVIEFVDGGFGHYWQDRPRESFCQMALYPRDVFVSNGYCVIGNIYENPGLLTSSVSPQ